MGKVWVISVNMGYGHQRTAYPLKHLAFDGKIINANDYEGIPTKDRNIWESTRSLYEFISKFKRIPLIGEFAFLIMNHFQKIMEFYPKRNLSKVGIQSKSIFSLIKNGWGKNLINKLVSNKDGLDKNPPLVTTFFTPAFMAEYFNYPGEIFCVICDADIARVWAPLKPNESRIKYFVPNDRVVERLKLYGVKPENIFLTGYPLPLENIGSEKMEILKEDLKYRLLNLDPKRKYFENYKTLIKNELGELSEKSDHLPTITFCVGGAGAQKEIGVKILKHLKQKIEKKEIGINLVAGIKKEVKEYFEKNILKIGLKENENVKIIFADNIEEYFEKFNQSLRKTDILWTKPSELSFYSALGLPIIIAPTIGSQEEFNKRWLLKSGCGIMQEDPNYVAQWLFDWLNRGYLAEAAMQGFIEGKKLGTFNIEKILCRG